uniref:Uncharacterized protein n=1 Tax=Setaria italica TaxID=4555 RepID=K3ZYW7_SETIT
MLVCSVCIHHPSSNPQSYRTRLSFIVHWLGPSFVLWRNGSNETGNSVSLRSKKCSTRWV